MKKILVLLTYIAAITFFIGCEDENDNPVFDQSQTVAPALTPLDSTEWTLTEETDTVAVSISWTPAEYNLDLIADPIYSLQMVLSGVDFSQAIELSNTSELNYSITGGDLNSMLVGKVFGTDTLMVDSTYTFDLKVTGSVVVNSDIDEVESAVLTVEITLYGSTGPVEYGKLWVPGDYQGWAPADAPNVWSVNNDGKYEGYVYFPDTDGATFEFKFTSDPDWDHTNYGSGGDGILDTDSGAGNLTVPGAGMYRFNVDTEALTWEYLATSWGVIGEFNAWAEDVNLVWDEENQYLTLTMDVPAADNNRFKFRANDDWAINLGETDPATGNLVQDGADIPIEAGNYTINLILSGPFPTYEVIKNE